MARQLLCNLLAEYLGTYVDLSSKNLSISLWSGKVELSNLLLRPGALDNFHIPIKFLRGSLAQLKITIPWFNLESRPVSVAIDGLYLIVSPTHINQIDKEELRKNLLDSRRTKLIAIVEAILSAQRPSGMNNALGMSPFLTNLLTTIVDNVEIVITNLHIRYEDTTTISQLPFSAGITIDHLSVFTTDENWVGSFVVRKSQSSAVCKFGVIEGVGLYCNCNASTFVDLSDEDLAIVMQHMIFTSNSNQSTSAARRLRNLEGTNYVLLTPNKLYAKIRYIQDEDGIQTSISVTIPTLELHIDKWQLAAIKLTCSLIAATELEKSLLIFMPRTRPRRSPRAWWHYLYVIVTGRLHSKLRTREMMMKCARLRRRYIQLVQLETSKRHPNLKLKNEPTLVFGAKEDAEMQSIEESLPFSALSLFREIATWEFLAKCSSTSDKNKSKKKNKKTKTKTAMAENNNIDSALTPQRTSFFMLDLNFEGAVSGCLYFEDQSMISLRSNIHGGLAIGDENNALKLQLVLDNVVVVDEYTGEYVVYTANLLSCEGTPADSSRHHRITERNEETSSTTTADCGAAPKVVLELSSSLSSLSIDIGTTLYLNFNQNIMENILQFISFDITAVLVTRLVDLTVARSTFLSTQLAKVVSEFNGSDTVEFKVLVDVANLTVLIPIQEGGSSSCSSSLKKSIQETVCLNAGFISSTCSLVDQSLDLQLFLRDLKVAVSRKNTNKSSVATGAMLETRTKSASSQNENTIASTSDIQVIIPSENQDPQNMFIKCTFSQAVTLKVIPDEFELLCRAVVIVSNTFIHGFSSVEVSLMNSRDHKETMMRSDHPSDQLQAQRLQPSTSGSVTFALQLSKGASLILDMTSYSVDISTDGVMAEFTSCNDCCSSGSSSISWLKFGDLELSCESPRRGRWKVLCVDIEADGDLLQAKGTNRQSIDSDGCHKFDKHKPKLQQRKVSLLLQIFSCINEEKQTATKMNIGASKLNLFIDALALNILEPVVRLFSKAIAMFIGEEGKEETTTHNDAGQKSGPFCIEVHFRIIFVLFMHQLQLEERKEASTSSPRSRDRNDSQRVWATVRNYNDTTTKMPMFVSKRTVVDTLSYVPVMSMTVSTCRVGVFMLEDMQSVEITLAAVDAHEQFETINTSLPDGKEVSRTKLLTFRNTSPVSDGRFIDLRSLCLASQVRALNSFCASSAGRQRDHFYYSYDGTSSNISIVLHLSQVHVILSANTVMPLIVTIQESVEAIVKVVSAFEFSSSQHQSQESAACAHTPTTSQVSSSAALSRTQRNHSDCPELRKSSSTSTSSCNLVGNHETTAQPSKASFDYSICLVKPHVALVSSSSSSSSSRTSNACIALVAQCDLISLQLQSECLQPDHGGSKSGAPHDVAHLSIDGFKVSLGKCYSQDGCYHHVEEVDEDKKECKECKECSFDSVSVSRILLQQTGGIVVHFAREWPSISPTAKATGDVVVTLSVAVGPISCIFSPQDLTAFVSILFAFINSFACNNLAPQSTVNDDTNISTALSSSSSSSSNLLDVLATGAGPAGQAGVSLNAVMQTDHVDIVLMNRSKASHQMPIMKAAISDVSISSEGRSRYNYLKCDGELAVSVDYFHDMIATWEPAVEKLRLILTAQSNLDGEISMSIAAPDGVQLVLSGGLTSSLLTAYSSLFSPIPADMDAIEDMSDPHSATDGTSSLFRFKNNLEFPIVIYASLTGREIATVSPGAIVTPSASLPPSQQQQQQYKSCKLFDVKVLGTAEWGDFYPLVQLPFSSNYRNSYSLLPMSQNKNASGLEVCDEPIVEVVAQYQRYVLAKWIAPLPHLGDPPQWTDGTGCEQFGDLKDVSLPSTDWAWVEKAWRVDFQGAVVGLEVDEEGWEYATNFSAFYVTRTRRTYRPMDIARRRLWVRTRRHVDQFDRSAASSKPCAVVWEGMRADDGIVELTLRSKVQMVNLLPFPLTVRLLDDDEGDCVVGGNIEIPADPLRPLNVPVLASRFMYMKAKPAVQDFHWSLPIFCPRGHQSSIPVDINMIPDLNLNNRSHTEQLSSSLRHIRFEGRDYSDVSVKIACLETAHAYTIYFVPPIVLKNLFPCELSVLCANEDGRLEVWTLKSGSEAKVTCVDTLSSVYVSVKLLDLPWTESVIVDAKNPLRSLRLQSAINSQEFCISMNAEEDSRGSLVLSFLSRFLLIDKSGLNLSVQQTKTNPDNNPLGASNKYFDIQNAFSLRRGSNGTTSFPMTAGPNQKLHMQEGLFEFVGTRDFIAVDTTSDDPTIGVGFSSGSAGANVCRIRVADVTSLKLFEITDPDKQTTYLFAYNVVPLPAPYSSSHLVTIMPRVRIVNHLDETLCCLQSDVGSSYPELSRKEEVGQRETRIAARNSSGWHKTNTAGGISLRLRTESSAWSIGVVDINEVGSKSILLPAKVAMASAVTDHINNSRKVQVIHIEIKIASGASLSSFYEVNVWPEVRDDRGRCEQAAFSIRNHTSFTLSVLQKHVDLQAIEVDPKRCEMMVPPSSWVPFGWTDPNLSNKSIELVLSSTTQLHQSDSQGVVEPCTINASTIGSKGTLMLTRLAGMYSGDDPYDMIVVEVKAGTSGTVIHATPSLTQDGQRQLQRLRSSINLANAIIKASSEKTAVKTSFNNLAFAMDLDAISISIIAERPVRREVLAAHLFGVHLFILHQVTSNQSRNVLTSLELAVSNIQVDNYSETCSHSRVVLHSFNAQRQEVMKKTGEIVQVNEGADGNALTNNEERNSATRSGGGKVISSLPFLTLTLVKQDIAESRTSASIFKYVALRMLEVILTVDSSSIQVIYCDFLKDILQAINRIGNFSSSADATTTSNPKIYFHCERTPKTFFENVVIHPMKVRFTFKPTMFPIREHEEELSTEEATAFRIVHNIAGIDDLAIKMKSFIVTNVFESTGTLIDLVVSKYLEELRYHLVEIAGSLFGALEVFGKPALLYKNIGDGVKDFFYEPYEGLMESPEGFLKGIQRGTGSLVSGVARGALTSTAAVVSGASKAMAASVGIMGGGSGDLLRMRDMRRRELPMSGGIGAGVRAGTESVIGGVSSGVSGLFTRPFEEGRKSGALGVLKGIGLGVAGAVVNPVVGISDGIGLIAQSFSEELSNTVSVTNARPPRALDRRVANFRCPVVVPLDISAAHAQSYVRNAATTGGYRDTFVAHICIDHMTPGGAFAGLSQSPPMRHTNSVASVVVSEIYIFLLRRDASLDRRYPFSTVSHCSVNLENHTIILHLYPDASTRKSANGSNHEVQIACHNLGSVKELYAAIWQCSSQVGNPALMPPMAIVEQGKGVVAIADQKEKRRYRFGSANDMILPFERLTESQILHRLLKGMTKASAVEVSDDTMRSFRDLDELVWKGLDAWRANHTGLNCCRFSATLVLNFSEIPFQLLRVDLIGGKRVKIMGGAKYEKDSQTVASRGGAVLLFAWGILPSLFDPAHVTLAITTSSFSACVSTRSSCTYIKPYGGAVAGFQEKSNFELFAKYVITVG